MSRRYYPSRVKLIKNTDPIALNFTNVTNDYQDLPDIGEQQDTHQMLLEINKIAKGNAQ